MSKGKGVASEPASELASEVASSSHQTKTDMQKKSNFSSKTKSFSKPSESYQILSKVGNACTLKYRVCPGDLEHCFRVGTSLKFPDCEAAMNEMLLVEKLFPDQNPFIIRPREVLVISDDICACVEESKTNVSYYLLFPFEVTKLMEWMNKSCCSCSKDDLFNIISNIVKSLQYIFYERRSHLNLEDGICIADDMKIYLWNFTPNTEKSWKEYISELETILNLIKQMMNGLEHTLEIDKFCKFIGIVQKDHKSSKFSDSDMYEFVLNFPPFWNNEQRIRFLATIHHLYDSENLKKNKYFEKYLITNSSLGNWQESVSTDPVMLNILKDRRRLGGYPSIGSVGCFAHNFLKHYHTKNTNPSKLLEDVIRQLLLELPTLLTDLYDALHHVIESKKFLPRYSCHDILRNKIVC